MTRSGVFKLGLAVVATLVVGGATLFELVENGVLPGKLTLDKLDGACDVSHPPLHFAEPGPSYSRSFYSHARNREVGYTIAYPPGHKLGDRLPLVVMLHGEGGDHTGTIGGLSPAKALALQVDGAPLRPMAIVTVDGGRGYWNPHPGDDPMGMVVDELIPLVRRLGLGVAPHTTGVLGISMGGYGAILFAEKFPHLFRAAAAISPAVWTSYAQANGVNSAAYASSAAFASADAVTHARALTGIPVRVASGNDDPFHPGVVALAKVLPPDAIVELSAGCHSGPFFLQQTPPSLAFLSRHLGGAHDG
ncbi:MAG TPA: alpha/beta hydrolase-fold protein [Gaiellaceae bacterium]